MPTDQDAAQLSQETNPEKGESSAPVGTDQSSSPVFTQDQVKAEVSKAVQAALTAAGRDARAIADGKKAVDDARAELEHARAEMERQRQEAEEAEAADDPDRLSAIKLKRKAEETLTAARKRLDMAERKEKELEAEITEARQLKKERMVNQIAARHSVDPALLMDYADLPVERLEKLAMTFPRKELPVQRTDSGKTSGSGMGKMDAYAAYVRGEISSEEAKKRGAVFT